MEFRGLLDKERRVIDVDAPSVELVKEVIVKTLGKVGAEGEGNASV